MRASIDFLLSRHPVLVLLGGDSDPGRTDLAAMLAAQMVPVPGARVIPIARAGEAAWREANDVLTAGCSVVIEGTFTDAAERRHAAGMASCLAVPSHAFFLGEPPMGLDTGLWRTLDANGGALTALASAVTSLTAAGA